MHEKEHDFFPFHGTWLLFLFSLVASLLCLPPHCAPAMKESRIVKGLVALALFYFFAQCIHTADSRGLGGFRYLCMCSEYCMVELLHGNMVSVVLVNLRIIVFLCV